MVEMDLLPDVKLDVALAHMVSVGNFYNNCSIRNKDPLMTSVLSGEWMKLEGGNVKKGSL